MFNFGRAFGEIIYVGLKSLSISTPNSFFGKSLICPKEESTTCFPFKNFVIVLALVGDSTIIRDILL